MRIINNLPVPTGNILIVEGEKGELECLSIGDYGKEKNLKADFLGLKQEINGVPHGELLPLSEKWVVTISTQYGCSMGCNFCDVPKVGPGVNATFSDILGQIKAAVSLHPEITASKRLNIHYARMGEPTWNPAVLDSSAWLRANFNKAFKIHPVVSTMMPRANKNLHAFIEKWMDIKNNLYNGNAGLQISINSTDKSQRESMFKGSALELAEIYEVMKNIRQISGRKIALNIALCDDYIVDPEELLRWFNPDRYLVKITPMHYTKTCREKGIITKFGYTQYQSYKEVEERCKWAGYDVIVFVPSIEEDKSRITCGNAILSDGKEAKP